MAKIVLTTLDKAKEEIKKKEAKKILIANDIIRDRQKYLLIKGIEDKLGEEEPKLDSYIGQVVSREKKIQRNIKLIQYNTELLEQEEQRLKTLKTRKEVISKAIRIGYLISSIKNLKDHNTYLSDRIKYWSDNASVVESSIESLKGKLLKLGKVRKM